MVERRRMRLFIGIVPDESTRMACTAIAERLHTNGVYARYVDAKNYHLTLAFLGNVDMDRIEEITAAIDAIALRHALFDLSFDRIGAFPNERRPRVVFVGSRGSSPQYRALAEDVRAACEELRFTLEHEDAVPHITVARVAKSDHRPLPMLDIEKFTARITALTLFESTPTEGATRYSVLHRSPLTGATNFPRG